MSVVASNALASDPLGRLFSVTSPSTATQFLYDGHALVGEYVSGTMTQRYVHGPGMDVPLLSYAGANLGTPSYLHADERGSIVAIGDPWGAGTVNRYDEYGIPASTNVGRFQYTGQIWLPEIGMYHYKARAYSPTLGRFMQTDPIGYAGGMNLYGYVLNDPVNLADPYGTCHRESWRMWWWTGDGETPLGPVDGSEPWDVYVNCEGVFTPETLLFSTPFGFDLAWTGADPGDQCTPANMPAQFVLAGFTVHGDSKGERPGLSSNGTRYLSDLPGGFVAAESVFIGLMRLVGDTGMDPGSMFEPLIIGRGIPSGIQLRVGFDRQRWISPRIDIPANTFTLRLPETIHFSGGEGNQCPR